MEHQNKTETVKPSDKEQAEKGIWIPKSRFDEINGKYKESRIYARKLEEIISAMDEKISHLEDCVKRTESQYAEERTILELKGIFVDGGFHKKEYEGIIARLSCPTRQEKVELAKEIVKLKNNN